MSLASDITKAIRSTVVLWILTAILYPLVMIAFGQVVFPFQANGSLVRNAQNEIVGSALIGQPFTSDRYFTSRPSAIAYSSATIAGDPNGILNTGTSGGSNLAPSHPDLTKRIQGDVQKLKKAGIKPTADLVYTSGSGLDPHISIESALNQIPRVAKARKIDSNQLEIMINQATEQRFLGIFGEPGVNVVKLNLALDAINS